MLQTKGAVALALISVMSVSACGGGKEPRLMHVRTTQQGPDEFAILPNKPLEKPETYAQLPTPTPGGTNVVDPTPEADAVAALGGKRASVTRNGTLGNDGALVGHATRYGVAANIRQTLAAEDLEFRRDNKGRILERWAKVNVYLRAYEKQSLNKYRELARLRRLGVRTPAAPPPKDE